MRTTIRLNSELTRRAKAYAARHRKTFTETIEEAVSKLVAADATPARARKRVVLPVVGDPKKRITEQQYREAIQKMYEEDAEYIRRGCK